MDTQITPNDQAELLPETGLSTDQAPAQGDAFEHIIRGIDITGDGRSGTYKWMEIHG